MRKTIILTIITLVSLFSGVKYSKAATMTPVWGVKFTRGVTNTTYWVSSSATAYTLYTNDAAWGWAKMNNKIYITPVSSNAGSHIDVYAYTPSSNTEVGSDVIAYVTFWNKSNERVQYTASSAPYSDYFWAEVNIGKGQSCLSSAVVTHEFGHAFGVAHSSDQANSIMWPYGCSMKVSEPTSYDNNAINYLYP